MTKKSHIFWLISLIFLIGTIPLVNSTQLDCDQENPPLQCLLFREYPQINDELGCQLCAVAIQSGKYPQKANQYCNDASGIIRNCGLISFTYLLTSERFEEAFDLEYEIFYRDPFNHDQRVSSILKKQNVRSTLIMWLEKSMDLIDSQIQLQRAIANLYLDDINESAKHLQNYLSSNSGVLDKQTIKLKCRIYEKQGQFNQAFNVLSQYIEKGEKDQRNYHMLQPYLYHLKGNLLMHHLKFDQAIIEFNKASSTFKSYYQEAAFYRGFKFSLFNIGLCYQKMSKHQEAINKYMDLIKHGVKNAQILNALGNSFIELALKQNPENPDKQKIRKSIFYLNRAIEDNPEYYLAHYNLGYAYLKSNEFQKAIEKFKQSLSIEKTSQAQYALLTAYFLLERYQDAENLITKNITVNEESIDDLLSVCYQYGSLDKHPKFYNKVLEQYEELIKSANGHYWKAMIQFEKQNYGLAIDHFLQAYDKGYSEPHLLFNLAYSYELLDDFKSALEYYEKAFKKDARLETKQKIQQCKTKVLVAQKNQQL